MYEIISTMLNQFKSKLNQLQEFGVTDDLKSTAFTLVFAAKRLDIKELTDVRKTLRGYMDVKEYKTVVHEGFSPNPDHDIHKLVKDNISFRACSDGEKYTKIVLLTQTNACMDKLGNIDMWKDSIRYYCYEHKIPCPIEEEGPAIDHH